MQNRTTFKDYVYAVLFASSGEFMLAVKLEQGYFFSESVSPLEGVVVRDGQRLNGGGKPALPGGSRQRNESIVDGSTRELLEETRIQGLPAFAVTDWIEASTRRQQGRQVTTRYGAAYFLVDAGELEKIVNATNVRLEKCVGPVIEKMKDGTITEYRQIFEAEEARENCPYDCELAAVEVKNVKTDWDLIQPWNTDSDLGWFYVILDHLRGTVLPKTQTQ